MISYRKNFVQFREWRRPRQLKQILIAKFLDSLCKLNTILSRDMSKIKADEVLDVIDNELVAAVVVDSSPDLFVSVKDGTYQS